MKTREPTPIVDLSQSESQRRELSALVIMEVVVASSLTPIMWQGFKRFTALGQLEVSSGFNFSSGIVTLLVASILFLVHRKSLTEYGFSLNNWPDHLKIGIALTVIVMLVGLLSRILFVKLSGNFHSDYGSSQSPYLFDAAMAVFFLAIFPQILSFVRRYAVLVPTSVAVAVLLSLWMIPLAVAGVRHLSLVHTSLVVLGLIVTTGLIEELFYWGYILPRLDEVLGRPCSFGGIRFGWGLAITTLLFGLIHGLNGVDFLHGHFNLNWGWGSAALLAGLAHGLLREGTGSIVPGAVLHGINDSWLLVVIPMILSK